MTAAVPTQPIPRRRRVVLIVSLLLLAATMALWLRAQRGRVDAAALFVHGGRTSGVASTRGQILFVLSNLRLDDRRAWTIQTVSVNSDDFYHLKAALIEPPSHLRHLAGFAFAWRNDWPAHLGSWHLAIGLPHWFVALLFMTPTLNLARRRYILHRRRKLNLCLICGYDLRATPTGRCPECGAEQEVAQASRP